MEPAYPCKALVLHCIDFRFRKTLGEFLNSKFGYSYDLVSVAGGVKRLISDPAENNFILEQLKISDTLHKPNTIVLIQHEDCGAYGGSKAFNLSLMHISEPTRLGMISYAVFCFGPSDCWARAL